MIVFTVMLTTALANALQFGQIVRYDRASPFSQFKNSKQFNVLPVIDRISKAQLTPEESFKINVECVGISNSTCTKLRNGLTNASRKIGNELNISNTIVVNATIRDFCAGTILESCQFKTVLGAARYASAFVVKMNEKYYTASQAIVKQARIDIMPPFNDVDIIAEFNSGYDWFFPAEGGTIQEHQTDFEYVVAHELTHGLGFGTGLHDINSVFEEQLSDVQIAKGFLAPLPINITHTIQINSSFVVAGFEPIDLFDSHLYQGDTSFDELGAILTSFGNRNLPMGDFFKEFESSGAPFTSAKSLYQLSKNKSHFKTYTGKLIELYSPSRFTQGSSISHLTKTASETENYLMIPFLQPGISLEGKMQKYGKLYGEDVMQILETLGWTRFNSTNLLRLELQTDFKGEDPSKMKSDEFSFKISRMAVMLWILSCIWLIR